MFSVFPEGIRFEGCSLITGFHGIGAVGYWTVKFLVQKLEAERMAVVETDLSSPITSTAGGKIVTPYELLRKDNLVFFKAEVQPPPGSDVMFYRQLSDWIMNSGIKEVILVGGLDMNLRDDDTQFRLVHTSGYKPTKNLEPTKLLEDDRIIVGPVATMLNYFEIRNFPVYAILAYASPERVDPRGTAVAVEILSKYYSFEADVSSLIRGAEVIESEMTKHEDKSKRESESMYT